MTPLDFYDSKSDSGMLVIHYTYHYFITVSLANFLLCFWDMDYLNVIIVSVCSENLWWKKSNMILIGRLNCVKRSNLNLKWSQKNSSEVNWIITQILVCYTVSPDITDFGPTEHTVISGDPVTLKCQATGTPPPTIKWRKNSE